MNTLTWVLLALIVYLICVIVALAYFLKEYMRYVSENYDAIEPISMDETCDGESAYAER
jgi:TM2 domain-containing membrane protein YozV